MATVFVKKVRIYQLNLFKSIVEYCEHFSFSLSLLLVSGLVQNFPEIYGVVLESGHYDSKTSDAESTNWKFILRSNMGPYELWMQIDLKKI